MSFSTTISESRSFTITDAIHMAAKLAADLKRVQRLYPGGPSDAWISNLEDEAIQLLKAGYLGVATYGFQKNGQWVEPTLRYTAKDLAGGAANDDDPGRVRPGADVTGATFRTYMTYSSAWDALTPTQRESFKNGLRLQRGDGKEPTLNGYLTRDRIYSSGGRALDRSSLRSY